MKFSETFTNNPSYVQSEIFTSDEKLSFIQQVHLLKIENPQELIGLIIQRIENTSALISSFAFQLTYTQKTFKTHNWNTKAKAIELNATTNLSMHIQSIHEVISDISFFELLYSTIELKIDSCEKIESSNEHDPHLRRLKGVIDHAETMVWEVDPKGTYTYSNDVCEKILGIKAEKLVGKTVFDFIPIEERLRIKYIILDLMKKRNSVNRFLTQLQNIEGETIWVEASGKPIFDQDGEYIGYMGVTTSIQNYKEAELGLKFYETIYHTSSTMFASIDPKTKRLARCNKTLLSKTGFTEEELLSKKVNELFTDDSQPNVKRALKSFKETGRINGIELRLKTKYTEPIDVKLQTQAIFDDAGNILYSNTTLVDITDIKEKEEELLQRNELIENILEALPDCIITTDSEGINTPLHSSRKERNHLYTQLFAFNSIYDNPNNITVSKQAQYIQLCLLTGSLYTYEYTQESNGKTYRFRERIVRKNNNEVLRFVQNITNQFNNQDEITRLRESIDQSPDQIIIASNEGIIEFVNKSFTEISGYESDEVLGKNVRVLKSKMNPASLYQEMWNTITKNQVWNGEWINQKKDGELYWESIRIAPVLNTAGNRTHFIAIKTDISNYKAQEAEIKALNYNLEQRIKNRTEELEIAKDEAIMANKAKSVFLSRMSHELRTPMNAIIGFGQLLDMLSLPNPHNEWVKHIVSSGRHLLDLINEILEISRIESGRVSLEKESFEISTYFHSLIESMSPLMQKKGLKHELNLPSENSYIISDKKRLSQTFLNILGNAIKYNKDKGSIIIDVRIQQTNNIHYLHIDFTDTGIGIKAESLDKIFEPFERIDAENSQVEGTGLGLSVVKELVEFMGGNVHAESTYGSGSKFCVQIPIELDHLSKEFNKPISNDLNMDLLTQFKSFNGLITLIEDNESNIKLIQEIFHLHLANAKLDILKNGQEALTYLKTTEAELILLDLNLPDLKGEEIIKQVRKERGKKNCPIIVISADAMPSRILHSLKLGANDYIAKPIQVKKLLKSLGKHLFETK